MGLFNCNKSQKPATCTNVCCGPPVPFEKRKIHPFPEYMWEFPCTVWHGILFMWPLREGVTFDKLAWAVKGASQRWEDAFEFKLIGDLDEVDFTLAVFAMAWELKLFLPQIRLHMGFSYKTFEHWKFAVKDLLHTSYEIRVKDELPRFSIPEYHRVLEFADVALDWVWTEADSGGCVTPRAFSHEVWVDRYIPLPEELELQPATVVTTKDENDPNSESIVIVRFYNGYDEVVKECHDMEEAMRYWQDCEDSMKAASKRAFLKATPPTLAHGASSGSSVPKADEKNDKTVNTVEAQPDETYSTPKTSKPGTFDVKTKSELFKSFKFKFKFRTNSDLRPETKASSVSRTN